jgi:tetratricopeptide (TPR) repeat protein
MKTFSLITLIFFLVFSDNFSQAFQDGLRFYHEKKYDDAIGIFNSVKKGTPHYGESLYYLGKIYSEQNKLSEAQGFLEKAVGQDPQNPEFHMALGTVYTQRVMQSNTLMQAMYAGKIKSSFEKVAELDNQNIIARWYLFGFYARAPKAMGGDINKSKKMANEITKINAAEGSRAWGQIYYIEEKFDEADKAFRRALSLQPDSLLNHISLGNFFANREKYSEAFQIYENAIKKFPDNRNLLFQIGRTSSISGEKPESGIMALKKYIESAPDKNSSSLAGTYYHLGNIEQKRGNIQLARRNFEIALKLNPDHKPSREALEKL